jgi:hypothetical protein
MEDPSNWEIEANLTRRERFDAALRFGNYMHSNTYVLYGHDLATETGSVLQGGGMLPIVLNEGNKGPANGGDGTVPAISASASTQAIVVGLPNVNHGALVNNAKAIAQIMTFVADAIRKCPAHAAGSATGPVSTFQSQLGALSA